MVLGSHKTLELRPISVDKASALRRVFKDLGVDGMSHDFFLAIGDGRTDEPVFQYFKEEEVTSQKYPQIITSTVGRKKQTEAAMYLRNVDDVVAVLKALVQ